MAYLPDVVQEATGRSQRPLTLLPLTGSVIVLFIGAIVFSISSILTFRVSASANSSALDYLSLLRVTLNS